MRWYKQLGLETTVGALIGDRHLKRSSVQVVVQVQASRGGAQSRQCHKLCVQSQRVVCVLHAQQRPAVLCWEPKLQRIGQKGGCAAQLVAASQGTRCLQGHLAGWDAAGAWGSMGQLQRSVQRMGRRSRGGGGAGPPTPWGVHGWPARAWRETLPQRPAGCCGGKGAPAPAAAP